MNQEDYIVRAMGADRQLRLFAVTSRNLVERARDSQYQSGGNGCIGSSAYGGQYDGQYDERR